MVRCVTVNRRHGWGVGLCVAAVSLACSDERPGGLDDSSRSDSDTSEPTPVNPPGSDDPRNTSNLDDTNDSGSADGTSNNSANENGVTGEGDGGAIRLLPDASNGTSSGDAGNDLAGSLFNGPFDEGEVYLVAEGNGVEECFTPVVNLRTGSYACGMPYDFGQPIIHDSKILFHNINRDFGLYELVPDLVLGDPLANDTLLATPPCNEENHIWSWQLSPSGTRVHQCADGFWYDADGTVLSQTDVNYEVIRAMTDTKVALVTEDFQDTPHVELLDLSADSWISVPDLSDRVILAARASGIGIRVAVAGTEADEVWDITPEGSAEFVTSLAPLPNDLEPVGSRTGGQFSGEFALYQLVRNVTLSFDEAAIVRRTLDGDVEVVRSEGSFFFLDSLNTLITGR